MHLFKNCHVARAIGFASKWCILFDDLPGNNIKDIIKAIWLDHDGAGLICKLLIVTCLWYSIWHMRNEVQFWGKLDMRQVVLKFESMVEEFGNISKGKLPSTKPKDLSLWKPLNLGTLAINVDASMGNGSFSWAMVGRDSSETLIFFASQWGTGSTLFIAECQALVWATKIALEFRWQNVE